MRSATPSPSRVSAARRRRILALGYDYPGQPKQPVGACNLCGGRKFLVLAHRDRYGYPARASGCRRCGLVFLDPVMTSSAYSRFYIDVYRPLVSAYHGRRIDARTIQGEQRAYAVERGDLLEPFLAKGSFRTLLDIGGSTGVVASEWCRRFGLQGTVIDPAPLEIQEARALGLSTIAGFVEDFEAGNRKFDVVVMCQTIDHLLDITGSLASIRSLIRPGGVFFVDIVDLRAAFLRNWSVEEAIKIDHPYYLTESTALAYLRRSGFDVLRMDYAADHLHVGYVCRPCPPDRGYLPPQAAPDALWHEARFVQNTPGPR